MSRRPVFFYNLCKLRQLVCAFEKLNKDNILYGRNRIFVYIYKRNDPPYDPMCSIPLGHSAPQFNKVSMDLLKNRNITCYIRICNHIVIYWVAYFLVLPSIAFSLLVFDSALRVWMCVSEKCVFVCVCVLLIQFICVYTECTLINPFSRGSPSLGIKISREFYVNSRKK